MNRSRWILLVASVLLLFNIGWIIYSRWGLITIQANGKPLSEVVRSIEHQGNIVLRTDLEPNTPVTMHVNRVPLSEALETLSTVTESRWRLTYMMAGSRSDISAALGTFTAGQKPDGWKTLFVPTPPMVDDGVTIPDPRRDTWEVKEPTEKTVQAYLEQGARNVAAAFMFPTAWNPPVASAPAPGEVRSVAPKIAKLAHGEQQEVFLLMKSRRPDFVEGGDGGGPPRDWMGVQDKAQAQINKLPPERRAAAQAEFDENSSFFKGLAELPPDQRRSRMEDFMQQPKIQDKMDDRMMARDARMTPEQRLQRAQGYAQRRQDVRSGGATK